MKPRIGILAALPREIEPLIGGWPVRRQSRLDGTLIAECEQAIAVCAGMGSDRVAIALELAESCGPLHSIISVGYAGALREGTERNTVWWPATTIDATTGERYESEGGSGTLVTLGRVAGREEKAQLARRWNADLVDMEAAVVARMAQMRNLPFRALKVVSDEAGDGMPDMNRFINERGGFREAAFAAHLVLHPWMIPSTIRLGRDSMRGSEEMARVLRRLLETTE
ncbi:MAG: phosphorylase [Acidobacteriaceae bacterium]